MKKLLLRFFLLMILCAATAWPWFSSAVINNTDRFSSKFEYRAGSLITGSSRALLGLDPDRIVPDKSCGQPFLNFAFTQVTSPYGEVYYEAIRKKVKGENGLFIIEVNPLSVSSNKQKYPEAGLILGRMHFFNLDPNPDYAVQNMPYPPYLFFLDEKKSNLSGGNTVYHANGWNECIRVPANLDTAVNNRKMYQSHLDLFSVSGLSPYRMKWLNETIHMLSQHGQVVLLRMPVADQMKTLEQKFYPEFDHEIQKLADQHHISYLNMTETEGWEYYDLHHMKSGSAIRFSELLGDTLADILPLGIDDRN